MLFTSFPFLCLLFITFFLYYFTFLSRYQIPILIISSLVFYSYDQPVLVFLFLTSVGINIISSYYIVYGNDRYKKIFAVLGVALNLSILLFFKYSPLLVKTFMKEPGSVGEFLLSMPLPIGISFFTFQGISLVVDVFKEKYSDNKKLVPPSFLLHAKQILFFKGFFPQLISGPIVKAHDFIPQIGYKSIKDIQWESVFKNLVIGYFLKMVVADNLKDFTFWIAYPHFLNLSSLTLIVLLFGFSCQIFADFAGYSLIAIGLAKLFGYHFPDNFNFPYIATSFKEFWKRWHISLSSFLMEYLYIPLGGNRKGKIRTYVNLMVVMLLGGIWHGAAWSYAVWGGFHGLALSLERLVEGKIKIKNRLILLLKGGMVFCFVTLAWLMFKLPNFEEVIQFFKCIGANSRMNDNYYTMTYIVLYSMPILIYHLFYLAKEKAIVVKLRKVDYLFYGIMIFLIITNSGSSGTFIYFQF